MGVIGAKKECREAHLEQGGLGGIAATAVLSSGLKCSELGLLAHRGGRMENAWKKNGEKALPS